MACRISRSSEWGARLLHELSYFPEKSFITLTYDWEHVPHTHKSVYSRLTLKRTDLQLFLKRLRKHERGRQIKYFGCGEYGDKMGRPHYHLILLGVAHDAHEYVKQGNMKGIAISGPCVDCWENGHVFVGTVTADSIRYVADYLKKCYKGRQAQAVYGKSERPFQCISQGIGKRFALKEADYLRFNLGVTVQGTQVGLPRYYRKLLDITAENTPQLVKKAKDAYLKNMEKVVERVIREGVPDGLTFEGAIQKWMDGSRNQRELALRRKVELRQKGNQ